MTQIRVSLEQKFLTSKSSFINPEWNSNVQHPVVIMGHFYSHRTQWGYSNEEGHGDTYWADTNDVILVYVNKNKGRNSIRPVEESTIIPIPICFVFVVVCSWQWSH